MPKRETYSISFECPGCSEKGEVTISENEYPHYCKGKLNQKIEDVSEGFRIINNTKIICNKCKNERII